jgi:hypothetical protein
VYLIGGTALSWSSTRQKSVSLSTTEAEYIASGGATQELIWLQRLLKDVQNIFLCPVPQAVDVPATPLHIDNQSAIDVFDANSRVSEANKNISCHLVREKALPLIKHEKHVEAMKLLPLPPTGTK